MTPKPISEYLSAIGRKGGQAGKGTPARVESNRRATAASWTPAARAKRAAGRAAKEAAKPEIKP